MEFGLPTKCELPSIYWMHRMQNDEYLTRDYSFVRSFVGRRFLHLHCSKEALSPGPQGPTPAAEPKDSQGWIPYTY